MRTFTHKSPRSAGRVRALRAGAAALGQPARMRPRIAGGS